MGWRWGWLNGGGWCGDHWGVNVRGAKEGLGQWDHEEGNERSQGPQVMGFGREEWAGLQVVGCAQLGQALIGARVSGGAF